MIIGTAGHIDHGKTSLVRALTGVDTDRLKEEKTRGITIELGFAYHTLTNGATIGFIDVPGHERFVHTMLAGATGIDFVLLVVACDDGVMPQTREHAAIVNLLGLKRGVVALTKCDLVKSDRIGEVSAEVRALLANTELESLDIIPVSSVTGSGLKELVECLEQASTSTLDRKNSHRFRLAVDRVFSLAGAGTVVTGTVASGTIEVGDTVAISPGGLQARVRGIHAQNRKVQSGSAGDRCALALTGQNVDTSSVARGDVILDPSLHHPASRVDAQFKLLESERKGLSQWLPVKFHCGSSERDAKLLVLRDGTLRPGETDFVQIQLAAALPLTVGDRFVVRDAAASRTMGGGVLLDVAPPERRRATSERRAELAVLCGNDPIAVLKALAAARGFLDLRSFFRDRALPQSQISTVSNSLELVTFEHADQICAMTAGGWLEYCSAISNALDAFHALHPDLPGLGQERLRLQMRPRLPAAVFDVVLRRLVSDGIVALDRSWVRRPDHTVTFTDEEERVWRGIVPLLSDIERFRPPRVRDISKSTQIDEAIVRRIFRMAARRGDVDELAKDHFFLAESVVEMADVARALASTVPDGEFSVIAFRDRLDNGRKVAIQILEFFDRQGLTMRRGDTRRINPHKRDLYSRSAPPAVPSQREGGETPPVGRPDFKSGEGRETVFGGFDSCLLRQPSSGERR